VFNSVLTKLIKIPTLNTEKTNLPKLAKNQHTETHKKPTYQNSQKTNIPKLTKNQHTKTHICEFFLCFTHFKLTKTHFKLTKNQHTETHKKPTYQNSQKTNLPKPTFM
jgi:hypothetical protein